MRRTEETAVDKGSAQQSSRTTADEEFDEVCRAILAVRNPTIPAFFTAAGLEEGSEEFIKAVAAFEKALKTTLVPPDYELPRLVVRYARSVLAGVMGDKKEKK